MFASRHIPYSQTNAFTKTVSAYLEGSEQLRPFYSERPDLPGLLEIIKKKQGQSVNRKLLADTLALQYKDVSSSELVRQNIESLLSENTFTVCTAHQPNL